MKVYWFKVQSLKFKVFDKNVKRKRKLHKEKRLLFNINEIKSKLYRKLEVWKESINFAVYIYKICKKFPKEELFGISSQLKRAAYSIPSNVAEGSSRQIKKEFSYFLFIAQGSCSELETFLELAKKLEWISDKEKDNLDKKAIKISKMLTGLIKSLKK